MHGTFGELADLLDYVLQSESSSPKALCRLGLVSSALAQRMQPLALLDVTGFELVVDSYGLRHALTGHSQERGSRDRYPLLEADIIALPG